jgi:3-deoxy-7-phosphoheptulonate synthase
MLAPLRTRDHLGRPRGSTCRDEAMTTVIVLTDPTTPAQQRRVVDLLRLSGAPVQVHGPTLLSTPGEQDRVSEILRDQQCVQDVAPISANYPKAARQSRGGGSTVSLGDTRIGGTGFTVIAGPCSVESRGQMFTIADRVRDAGGHALRGGVFKPRTSPYEFQGLGRPGIKLVAEARQRTGLPVVTEILDLGDLDPLSRAVDMLQIGARNMQNYPLLREVGRTGLPVLLKRGLAATVDETLLAAEYVLNAGNDQLVICERGIRSFESSYRFTLDLAAVTVFKERTHLPVIVDPSHAAGRTHRVMPLALAAAASGADGIIVETHCNPAAALCDGRQALPTDQLPELIRRLSLAVAAAGRHLTPATTAQHPHRRQIRLVGEPVGPKAAARIVPD